MNNFFNEFLFLCWVFLPAIIANMAPVFAAKLPVLSGWSYPLDFYGSFRGRRVLGDHKTIRGLIAGIIVGIVVTLLQFGLADIWPALHGKLPEFYLSASPVILGFLLGFGALAGDAIKSFFKRALNIAPGRPWFPFDQLDSVLGALLATALYLPFSGTDWVIIIVGGVVVHLLVVVIGYFLGIRDHII